MDRNRFSASVRRVADDHASCTAWDIASALLQAHPTEYGADGAAPRCPRAKAVTRTVDEWLDRCDALIAPEAIDEVIDGRMVLLALGRLEDSLGRTLRRAGVERHLLRRGNPLASWAQRSAVIGYVERTSIAGRHNTCAFSPDGRWLAVGGDDGLWLWDVASGKVDRQLLDPRDPVVDCAFSPTVRGSRSR